VGWSDQHPQKGWPEILLTKSFPKPMHTEFLSTGAGAGRYGGTHFSGALAKYLVAWKEMRTPRSFPVLTGR